MPRGGSRGVAGNPGKKTPNRAGFCLRGLRLFQAIWGYLRGGGGGGGGGWEGGKLVCLF